MVGRRNHPAAKRKKCTLLLLLLAFSLLLYGIFWGVTLQMATRHHVQYFSLSDPTFFIQNNNNNKPIIVTPMTQKRQQNDNTEKDFVDTYSHGIFQTMSTLHTIFKADEDEGHSKIHLSLELLPTWMQEYFQWHYRQRKLLVTKATRKQSLSSMRFLLMECWPWNTVCGGTADRLRSIPLMILVAYQTQRLLLIKWGRPAELEEFLLPPKGGWLNWRVPSWLVPHLANASQYHAATRIDKLLQLASLTNETVVTTRLQAHDYGAQYYNDHRQVGEPLLRDVYREIWRNVFTPTTPVASRIQQFLTRLGLVPGHYVAAHVRALYLVDEKGRMQAPDRKPQQIQRWAENAVNCASMLHPGVPIFFASDSENATQMALEYGETLARQEEGATTIDGRVVVARQIMDGIGGNVKQRPFHLDKVLINDNDNNLGGGGGASSPADFYDTFVDLYLLGNSRCLTYNIGGYGKWGLLLGYNSSCGMRHQKGYGYKKDGLAQCHWQGQSAQHGESFSTSKNMMRADERPLILPPMD